MALFYFFLVFLMVIGSEVCHGADILYISLTPSKSHYIWDRSLALALKERNHKITLVSHYHEKSMENFTTIEFEGTLEKLQSMKSMDISKIKSVQSFYDVKNTFSLLTVFCKLNAKTNGLKELLSLVEYETKFDLLIIDLLCTQCLYPIIENMNISVIGTSQFGLMPFFTYSIGSDINSAYIPVYKLPYSDQMSFYQKTYSYFYGLLMLYWRQYVFMPEQWNIAKSIFGQNISTYQSAENKINLILANYNPVLDYPQPLPPTIIPVGGLHTQRNDVLSKDLQYIMDNSKNGIILFSLGTNILSADLKCPIIRHLINAFRQLKQTVIWKYENSIVGIPDNVIIRKWLPQNTILAHPNMKLFISHAGALSTQEAMFHAVPLVVVPMFADQFMNAEKIAHRKLGVRLQYHELTSDMIVDAVNEVVNNPIYKNNILVISRRYRDQQINPMAKAVRWVEYVLQHGDAIHLHIPARNMSWFSTLHLDIWICFTTVTFIVFYSTIFLFNNIYKICINNITFVTL